MPPVIPGAWCDAAVTQLALLHLAIIGRKQRIDEFDGTWHGKTGKPTQRA